jgi:hypothetical protein
MLLHPPHRTNANIARAGFIISLVPQRHTISLPLTLSLFSAPMSLRWPSTCAAPAPAAASSRQEVEGYVDAITFLAAHPSVDNPAIHRFWPCPAPLSCRPPPLRSTGAPPAASRCALCSTARTTAGAPSAPLSPTWAAAPFDVPMREGNRLHIAQLGRAPAAPAFTTASPCGGTCTPGRRMATRCCALWRQGACSCWRTARAAWRRRCSCDGCSTSA